MRARNLREVGRTLIALVMLTAPAVCRAGPSYNASETLANFGSVNQSDVAVGGIGDNSCAHLGVNALVFLQSTFASVYGTTLTGGTNDANNLVTTAQALAGVNFMNTANPGGTFNRDVVYGMVNYIESVNPGKTAYAGQVVTEDNAPINSAGAAWGGARPQPSYVQGVYPTLAFLNNYLMANAAIEFGIVYTNNTYSGAPAGAMLGPGHELDLQSLVWNGDTNTGTIGIVDPLNAGGNGGPTVMTTANISLGTVPGGAAPVIDLTYTQPSGTTIYAYMDSAFTEVAIPEPSSILMLATGGVFVGFYAFRRRPRHAA